MPALRYISLFSGIEAASCAWHKRGWEPVAFAEVDRAASEVLEHRWPDVPNLGDITKITDEQIKALGPVDLVVAGWPCTDVSIAGKRKGFKNVDGTLTRSGLFFEAIRLIRAANPRWLVAENVPGLFSQHGGRDFATVVSETLGLTFDVPRGGWQNSGIAASARGRLEWAELDAQFWNLAQRRERVFFVGYFGADWGDFGPVLLERESLLWNPPPSRTPRQDITHELSPCIGASGRGFERAGETRGQDPVVACIAPPITGNPYGDHESREGLLVAHSLRGEGFDASEDGTGRGTPIVPVYAIQERAVSENPDAGPDGVGVQPDIAYTLEARQQVQAVAYGGNNTSGSIEVATALNAKGGTGRSDFESETLIAFNGRMDPVHSTSVVGAIDTDPGTQCVAFALRGREGGAMPEMQGDTCGALRSASGGSTRSYVALMERGEDEEFTFDWQAGGEGSDASFRGKSRSYVCDKPGRSRALTANKTLALAAKTGVRRLVPVECEALQGFPRNYTRIPIKHYASKPNSKHYDKYPDQYDRNPDGTWTRYAADGPRYKQLGNSMPIPVMAWIGEKIDAVEAQLTHPQP
jgi:DNA (cytosine-5)-methyltransferase 1